MHIGAVILNFSQTGEILVSKIRDLYREDMQPVMDLTKGAELLYELDGKVYPVQFVSIQGYYYFCITFSYTHYFTFADVISNSAPKSKVRRVI